MHLLTQLPSTGHNPPHDNGYKVNFNDGAGIVEPHAKGIIAEVNAMRAAARARARVPRACPTRTTTGFPLRCPLWCVVRAGSRRHAHPAARVAPQARIRRRRWLSFFR